MSDATPISYQREDLTDQLWSDLIPLLKQHYEEVAHHKDFKLNPSRLQYDRIQASGGLRAYTAREGERLVGYAVFYVSRSMHYQAEIFANQDVLYVEPTLRGMGIAKRLDDYACLSLKAEGVSLVMQHGKAKAELDIGPFLIRQGYELVDHIYAKRLDR